MIKRAHNFKDLTGQRFGRLEVKKFSRVDEIKKTYWVCGCDCGKTVEILASGLRNGTKSCGCLKKEVLIKRNTTHGMGSNVKRNTLYVRWSSMKSRCSNPNEISYKNYGGRGIKVASEWLKFENFLDWSLASGFEEGLELDRIDNDKGYSPENCKWSTRSENQLNKRNNNHIEINGVKKTLSEWSRESGINIQTIKSRMRYGCPNDELLYPIGRYDRVVRERDSLGQFIS